MVVDSSSSTAAADLGFHALADPTRRDIVARAMRGDQSVSALARSYPMSFAAVQKHVAILERAGLVSKVRRGRESLVRTDIVGVRRVAELLDGYETLWRARLERFGEVLADATSPHSPSSASTGGPP